MLLGVRKVSLGVRNVLGRYNVCHTVVIGRIQPKRSVIKYTKWRQDQAVITWTQFRIGFKMGSGGYKLGRKQKASWPPGRQTCLKTIQKYFFVVVDIYQV